MNRVWFPKSKLIGADKRSKNIGEMYKPTIPKRFVQYGPKEEKGFLDVRLGVIFVGIQVTRKLFQVGLIKENGILIIILPVGILNVNIF